MAIANAGLVDPPMRTLSLLHPARKAAERSLGLGRFRRVAWKPEGPVGCCRATVAARIGQSGGEAAGGWLVHYWPGLFIEALFHCFWRSPSGEVLDLTEKYPGDPALVSTAAMSALPGFSIGPPSRHHVLADALEVRWLLAAAKEQAEHRLELEARIFARLDPAERGRPLWSFATHAEKAGLAAHETAVGIAMVACMDLPRRRG
jgi:hypothetical protein